MIDDPTNARPSLGEDLPGPVRTLHRAYLVGLGTLGVAQAVDVFSGLVPVWSGVVTLGVHFLVWAFHVTWLRVLFRDGKLALGDRLRLDEARVAFFALIGFVFVPAWSALAVAVLLRTTVQAVSEGGQETGFVRLRELSRDAPLLVWAGLLWMIVVVAANVVLYQSWASLSGEDTPNVAPAIRYLGLGGALALAAFELLTTVYWLLFVRRCAPALYRAWAAVPRQVV